MPIGTHFPAWLVRRRYFQRIGRWTKPRKRPPLATAVAPDRSDAPSNVLPFRGPAVKVRRTEFPPRLGVGTA